VMPCIKYGGAIVCMPTMEYCKIIWHLCPTCEKRSPMVSRLFAWYGVDDICLRCGEFYQDGERAERPFERAWRKKNIAHAKEVYRRVHPRGEDKVSVREG